MEIKGRLGVGDDWAKRWETLSHGERKRAQIAVALWPEPQVLAVDEPTQTTLTPKHRIFFLPHSPVFTVSGLLVSHDRRLLDDLCSRCLFVDPPDAVMRPGNYSLGLEQAETEATADRKKHASAKQDFSRLRREAVRRREAASRADRKRSKRGLSKKDRDAKEKIHRARVTGKDGVDGKRLRQIEGRLDQARLKMDGIKVKKNVRNGHPDAGRRIETKHVVRRTRRVSFPRKKPPAAFPRSVHETRRPDHPYRTERRRKKHVSRPCHTIARPARGSRRLRAAGNRHP